MRSPKICVITSTGKRVCGRPMGGRVFRESGAAAQWVARIDGDRVYAVTEYPLSDEPAMRRLSFLLPSVRAGIIKDGDPISNQGGGVFSWGSGYDKRMAIAKNKDAADKIEVIPVPRPKVRANVQTKWNDSYGRWEKLTAKGWVPA